jgi:hypothetical protein
MATSVYEESRMPSISDLLHYSNQLWQLESTAYLFEVWTKFHGLLVLMAAGLLVGIARRAWLRTIWVIVFTVLFMALVLIVDREGKAPTIYENYYPVIGMVWVVHFISLATGQGLWMRRLRAVLFVGICTLGVMQIHRAHYRMSEKVAYLQRITTFWELQGERKILVKEESYPWYYGIGLWPLAFESALSSAGNGPLYAATVFVSSDHALLDSCRTRPEQFLGPLWAPLMFHIPELDQRYFDLPTDDGYHWVNTCDTVFDLNDLDMKGPGHPFRMVPDRYTVVPISIHNPTTMRMPSCTADGHPVRMGYRLFRKDGTEYAMGSETIALESDIPPGMTYHQSLVIERPPDHGTYWVIADLLVDGQPFGKYTSFDLVVDGWPF